MSIFTQLVKKRKKNYKALAGSQILLYIKDINVLKVVKILGSSKFLVRVEHYDGTIRKYTKESVVLLPYDKDTEETINKSVESIKFETGTLKQLIDKRAYTFKR